MDAVELRSATAADADLLFAWANTADSRAASLLTSAPIPWQEHLEWLAKRLKDPDTAIWIAEHGGQASGSVRLQGGEQGLEVAVYVRPEKRHQHVARTMLDVAAARAAGKWPGRPLRARVRHENRASLRLFEGAGYGEVERFDDHVLLIRRQPGAE